MPVAFYFPVTGEEFRMKAGMSPLGTDFGNGAADSQYFQRDEALGRYLAAKQRVPPSRYVFSREAGDEETLLAALGFLGAAAHAESLAPPPAEGTPAARLHAFFMSMQEDGVVLHRGEGAGRVVGLHVSFPSGWRPELKLHASFQDIHGPVPTFNTARLGEAMTRTMVEKGPFVRFVWTVCADEWLDHHPDVGRREPWGPTATRGWLRVERQVTVPIITGQAALFLVRTYLYPLQGLPAAHRETLARALRRMPSDIAAYKGLADVESILRVLGGG